MTDQAPEADAVEQATPLGAPPGEPTIGVETPEADALEQATTDADARDETPDIGVEVPEADAVEQAVVVETDDDYRD